MGVRPRIARRGQTENRAPGAHGRGPGVSRRSYDERISSLSSGGAVPKDLATGSNKSDVARDPEDDSRTPQIRFWAEGETHRWLSVDSSLAFEGVPAAGSVPGGPLRPHGNNTRENRNQITNMRA